MGKVAPGLPQLENWFYECLKDVGPGITYGQLWPRFRDLSGYKVRASKMYLANLKDAIDKHLVDSVSYYAGQGGRRYGRMDDRAFIEAKEAAETPPPQKPVGNAIQLGGIFQNSPVRSEWTHCPETNRIVKTTIITLGVADFMQCPVCSRAHFLGVSPKMQDQRLYAWQVDPLVNAVDYADVLTRDYIGDPKTLEPQASSIDRIRSKRGHYVGLMFRSSWKDDPIERLNQAMCEGQVAHAAKPRKRRGTARKARSPV